MPSGSCITEDKIKSVYYTDRVFWEPIQEYEIQDMIKYDDQKLCIHLGIEFLLFYTPMELELFLNKEIYAI